MSRHLEPSIAISIVVPTYNRRDSLLRLLRSLDHQTLDSAIFEIVVIDNNSTDGTREAVGQFVGRAGLHLRCISEPAQGTSHARNRGVRESAAPVVAFTDDDTEPDTGWLEEMLRGIHHYRAAAVGGRSEALWGAPLPPWWLPEYDKAFFRNWGDAPRPVDEFPFFYSLNLAIRRDTLAAVGGFDARLGPKGAEYIGGEDADLCRRIHQDGRLLYYLPRAVVRHHVGEDRLSREYLRRRFHGRGAAHSLQRAIEGRSLETAYQIKMLVRSVAGWISARSSTERFRRELDLRYRAAFLTHGRSLRRAARR